MTETKSNTSWLYDDLLAWLCPGGLLLTALLLRFPQGLNLLRERAPELTLPTWFAGAYVIGLALSPLGRIIYAVAQAIVWPHLRSAWSPAIEFLAARLNHDEAIIIPPAETMSVHVFHDVDRRMREYLEAIDPTSRPALNRMKVLCSLSCNSAAACLVFIILDALAGNIPTWSFSQIAAAALTTALALVAAVYRERRRQRTQLSVWRRCQIIDRV